MDIPEYGDLIFWVVFMIVLLIIELMTLGLTTIWFATGALVAAIVAMFTGPEMFLVQLVVFVIVSLIALLAVRPFLADGLKKVNEKNKTGIDTMIGKSGRVEEEIDNFKEKGRVDYNGQSWAARSADDTVIPADTAVTIVRIQGVKLIVEKTNN